MARASGLIKIEGTVENLTFFRKDGKNFVRKKGGVSRDRILNDPNYVRTRENMSEFAENGISGKVLRLAVGAMANRAKDSKLSSRLMQVMSQIKNLDSNSERGKRTVNEGIRTAEGKLLLKGFDFNLHSPLGTVLLAPFALDTATGVFSLPDLDTEEQIRYPQGATNVSFQSAVVNVDFVSGAFEIAYSPVVNLPIRLGTSPVTLTPTSVPHGLGTQLFLLLITFSQEVNGMQYPLKNEEFNVLQVIDVL